LIAGEPFLIQRLQQPLCRQIRLSLREQRGFPNFFVENVFLGVRGEIRARGHRNRAGEHRGKAGDDHHQIALRRALNPGQEADGADQSVLNAEHELADTRPTFDRLFFLLDGRDSHGG
jgi:hypothetical protein